MTNKNKKKKKKEKKVLLTPGSKLFLIVLLIPISVVVYIFFFIAWDNLKNSKLYQSLTLNEMEMIQSNFDLQIPEDYIPIYLSAEENYGVPWTLLAAHHRVETRFSTMSTLISPVGAEGHMQVRP